MEKSFNNLFKFINNILLSCPPLFYFTRLVYGLVMAALLIVPISVFISGFKQTFFRLNPKRSRPKTKYDLDSNSGIEESGFVTSDGVDIHFVSKGNPNGEVILFLHGFPECWYSWKHQIDFFSDKGYRVVAMSLRGYAESGKPKGVENYEQTKLANDVKELIEYLRCGKVILVGHDWGGVISWTFSAMHSEFITKLIILNAPISKIYLKLQKENIKQFLGSFYIYFFRVPYLPELALKLGDYAFLEMCCFELLQKGKITRNEVDLVKYYAAQDNALTAMINYYRAMISKGNLQLLEKLPKITVPTLVIWGEKDAALVVENLKGMNTFVDDLQVTRLPGVSHWVQQEDPETVNQEIIGFIS